MTELNIKKEIGRRILEARKAKGMTLKELGELAGGLKQTRLTNWEQGTRTPGPEEIKLLADALDVSPAFLMCLSDETVVKKVKNPSRLIPLLDYCQACNAKQYINTNRENESFYNVNYIAVSTELLPELSDKAFALKIEDSSMYPEIRTSDVLIVDPDAKPKPGDFVVVLLDGEQEVIVRKFKQLSATKEAQQYELVALNVDWADILVGSSKVNARIIGCAVSLYRTLRC